MSSVDAVSAEGVHVAGGSLFNGPGDNPLLDADGDGIYSGTFTRNANSSSQYTFLNGGSDWNQKEQIAGQSCANDPYNDRFLEWGTDDVVVNACFELCGDGFCSDIVPPATVEVTFNTDASEYNDQLIANGEAPLQVIHATGGFEGWSGYGVQLTDPDGDGTYVGVTEMVEGVDFEYKYVVGGWGSFESGAELGGPCDWNPNDNNNNYGAEVIGPGPMLLPTYVFGGGCEIYTPPPVQVVINELMYNPIHSNGGTNDDGEFIELLNIGSEAVNLSGWSFIDPQFVFPEGADIAPGEHLLVGRDSTEFFTQHGFHFEYEWTGGNLSNSGEDIVLLDQNNVIMDSIDYEDDALWYADLTDGTGHSLELIDAASDNNDPMSWKASEEIGGTPGAPNSTPPPPSPFAGTWKLSPIAGALKVGPNPNDGGWWSSSIEDTSNRACLFDDKYVLHPDGSFENVLGDQTWIEDWQGYGSANRDGHEGCAAPVAPHDGSNAATWSHNETDNKLTLDGVGAFLGLAKAFTGGELSADTEVPASRTYDIYQSDQNSFVVVISTGGGFWTFSMIRDGFDPPAPQFVDITINLDMSSVDAVSADGVYIAGGSLFNGPGDNPLLDADGDGIYSGTFTREANTGSNYTFTNGNCGD